MYERSYGYRYAEPGDHASNTEIAKRIRADIKQAQTEGLLPSRWTYSVRSDSMSINVDVRDCPDAWQTCTGTVPGEAHRVCPDVWCAGRNDPAYAHAAKYHTTLTEEARAAKMTLERIHGAYNHDGSEIQTDYFDVRYYGVVQFEDAFSADFRARERERLATRKASREAGKVIGRVANYGRDGRATVHVLKETADGKRVLACGARLSAHGFRGRVNDDAEVTCSRCKKHV